MITMMILELIKTLSFHNNASTRSASKFLGLDPSDAVNSSLNFMGKRVGNAGGAICINAKGQAGFGFNSERMAWAKITTKDTSSGVEPGDSIPF